jgi:hemolysin activation/secretion protein
MNVKFVALPLIAAVAMTLDVARADPVPSAAAAAAEQQLHQEQERLRYEQERAHPPILPSGMDLEPQHAPAPGAAASGSGPCADIKAVELVGADQIDEDDRAELIQRFAGRCLAAVDIQQLLAEVTQYYMAHGFITTRAYLPEQDLRSGKLRILVQEGTIERIEVRGDPRHRINTDLALPQRAGELLNIRDLEQAIDQINSAHGHIVKLDVLPGDKPGETVVVINDQPGNPVGIQLAADNQGTASTGRDSVNLNLVEGGLLGANETIGITARRTVPHNPDQSTDSLGLLFSVPVGYSTVGANFSESNYSLGVHIPGSTLPHYVSGRAVTMGLTYDRMLARDQNSTHKAVFELSSVNSRNYEDSMLLQVNSRRTNTLSAGLSSSMLTFGGVLTVTPRVVFGLNDQSNLPAGLNTLSAGTQAEFTKYTLDAAFSKDFKWGGQDLNWVSLFKGQYSPDSLFSAQQIIIGGLPSIRGYVSDALSGDTGFYWRNDVGAKIPLHIGASVINTRIYAGYDYGHVSSHDPQLVQGALSGVVLGWQAEWEDNRLDLSWARAVQMPTGMSRETGQLNARLVVSD